MKREPEGARPGGPRLDHSGNSLWPPTEWSSTGHIPDSLGQDIERLNELILRYQVPLKVYFLSAFPSLTSQADEWLQDFAEDKILDQVWRSQADRSRGRFRDFLKTSLRNFVKDRLRSNAKQPASLNELELDPPIEEQRSETFDLDCARVVLAEVFKRMEADCQAPCKDQPRRSYIWEVFRLRLLDPTLEDTEPVGYEELVKRFGIVSPFDAQNMLGTAKRIFERHLNAVIGECEKGEAAVQTEIAAIKLFLSRLGKRKGKQESNKSAQD
jgi:DNA-directed RNA polymerase specialized sigma24 family protein